MLGSHRNRLGLLLTLTVLLVAAAALSVWLWSRQPAGELKQIAEFGDNPTKLTMHLYVPPRVSPKPAVVLALHWCEGSGKDFYRNTRYAQLADEYGYLVIYPSATRASLCWDVHSQAALTRDGGSDPRGLLSMLAFVFERYQADRTRVFVTGHSSGGMMTQVLLATYPDVFQAGAAFASVPFGCFASETEWNEQCARGETTRSATQWADIVWHTYPEFAGVRPRVQLWHGTADDALDFHNFGESIKQWTHVLHAGIEPVATDKVAAGAAWIRTRYANSSNQIVLEAFRGEGVPHNFDLPAEHAISFFMLAPDL